VSGATTAETPDTRLRVHAVVMRLGGFIMAKHLIVVTCEESGFQGLYSDGVLVDQDDIIYACDIAEHSKDGPVDFSHVLVVMPEGETRYPEQFEQCMLWIPKESA
jgi:hypothetical protein